MVRLLSLIDLKLSLRVCLRVVELKYIKVPWYEFERGRVEHEVVHDYPSCKSMHPPFQVVCAESKQI